VNPSSGAILRSVRRQCAPLERGSKRYRTVKLTTGRALKRIRTTLVQSIYCDTRRSNNALGLDSSQRSRAAWRSNRVASGVTFSSQVDELSSRSVGSRGVRPKESDNQMDHWRDALQTHGSGQVSRSQPISIRKQLLRQTSWKHKRMIAT
jgi:hypothetical protein